MIDPLPEEDLTGRSFRLWDYSPSLSRLLIRSPRRDQNDYNVDIIFFGVVSLHLDTLIGEISIEAERLANPTYQRFHLRSKSEVSWVEAVSYVIQRSYTDYLESPLNTL